MKNAIILILLILAGCGGKKEYFHENVTRETPTFIQKGAIAIPVPTGTSFGETTPVVFNGEVLYVSTLIDNSGEHTRVFRKSDMAKLADVYTGMVLTSAIVAGNTLYVFGADNIQSSTVMMTSTTDLTNWTIPIPVFSAKDSAVWNTSVTTYPDGYIMAYEIGGGGMWQTRFATSTDLVNWTDVGSQYDPGYVTACPAIRFVNGQYYLFFTTHNQGGTDGHGYYAVNVARSTDLYQWEFSNTTVLYPLDFGDISNNASDFDFVEFNGQVLGVYANGSQWGTPYPNTGIREMLYNGPLNEFVLRFFQ